MINKYTQSSQFRKQVIDVVIKIFSGGGMRFEVKFKMNRHAEDKDRNMHFY